MNISNRAAWKQKVPTWLRFESECVWCGENFIYYSPISQETGKACGELSYCSRRCITEGRWEGRKKCPSAAVLRELYIMKLMSIPAIARKYKCSNSVITRGLHMAGVIMRKHTSVRSCKKCGAPVDKKFHHRRSKSDGTRILFGTLCAKHRREYFANWARKKSHRVDPLIGTRKVGGKPKVTICPKCRTVCPSRRAAVACCNQRWYKIIEANPNPVEVAA